MACAVEEQCEADRKRHRDQSGQVVFVGVGPDGAPEMREPHAEVERALGSAAELHETEGGLCANDCEQQVDQGQLGAGRQDTDGQKDRDRDRKGQPGSLRGDWNEREWDHGRHAVGPECGAPGIDVRGPPGQARHQLQRERDQIQERQEPQQPHCNPLPAGDRPGGAPQDRQQHPQGGKLQHHERERMLPRTEQGREDQGGGNRSCKPGSAGGGVDSSR